MLEQSFDISEIIIIPLEKLKEMKQKESKSLEQKEINLLAKQLEKINAYKSGIIESDFNNKNKFLFSAIIDFLIELYETARSYEPAKAKNILNCEKLIDSLLFHALYNSDPHYFILKNLRKDQRDLFFKKNGLSDFLKIEPFLSYRHLLLKYFSAYYWKNLKMVKLLDVILFNIVKDFHDYLQKIHQRFEHINIPQRPVIVAYNNCLLNVIMLKNYFLLPLEEDSKKHLKVININQFFDTFCDLSNAQKDYLNLDRTRNTYKSFQVKVNFDDMYWIFANLVDNAKTAFAFQDEQYIIFDVEKLPKKKINFIRIKVIDNGPGISPEDLSKIWGDFSTKGKGHGKGLGLVKKMVERNGGKISVESKVGKGTTFIIDFPLVTSPEQTHNQSTINATNTSL